MGRVAPLNDTCNGTGKTAFGPRVQCKVSIPRSGDGLLDVVRRDVNRHEEGAMFPISAVVRSSLGVLEIAGDDVRLQAVQKSAMKEHSVPCASLRVA